jgi:Domain of unknown function (DUF4167)
MRQGQHKNRSRGRGRRQGSPVNRVFESNGPDVKVRGNAQHVAEKYLQLARDAQSSGDSVMAENYYQHAEHYLRIVAAAQSFAQQNGPPGGIRRPFGSDDVEDEEADGPEDEDLVPAGHGPQPDIVDLQAQRPVRELQSREGEGESEQPREFRRPRERDFRDRDRDSRDSRDGRDSRDSRPPRESREFRDSREGREFRDAGGGEEAQGNGWSGHQPDFLRRASGTGSSGNGRFRRDGRPRGERKSEASGETQPSDNEPPPESSEDFASN